MTNQNCRYHITFIFFNKYDPQRAENTIVTKLIKKRVPCITHILMKIKLTRFGHSTMFAL